MFFVARVPKKTGLKFAAPKRWCSEATPQKKAEAGAGLVNFTLATPNNTFFRDQDVDSISLPGLEGEFIVNAQLVPIITELKPGVVTVNSGATQQKFFISGGFVFVHEGSICSVNPAECVGLENLDSELAKQELTEAKSAFSSAQNEQERAIAQIRIDTAQDIIDALK